MVRTIISLEPGDKRWLAERARVEHSSEAALIRKLIHRYRQETEVSFASAADVLERTSGLWQHGEALAYQRHLRDEW